MFRHLPIPALLAMIVFFSSVQVGPAQAEPLTPQAPANMSWIPHGYGGKMYVETSIDTVQKGVHGFRSIPKHVGAWSQPLWGWDVGGFCLGPQVPDPDPGELQLPIGLIYPSNGPELPPAAPRRAHSTKVYRQPSYAAANPGGPMPRGNYPGNPLPYSPSPAPSYPGAAMMRGPDAPSVVVPNQVPMSAPPAQPSMGYAPMANAYPMPEGYAGGPASYPGYQ